MLEIALKLFKLTQFYSGVLNLYNSYSNIRYRYKCLFDERIKEDVYKEFNGRFTSLYVMISIPRGPQRPMAKKLPTLIKMFDTYCFVRDEQEKKGDSKRLIFKLSNNIPQVLCSKIEEIYETEFELDKNWVNEYIDNFEDNLELEDKQTKAFYDELSDEGK